MDEAAREEPSDKVELGSLTGESSGSIEAPTASDRMYRMSFSGFRWLSHSPRARRRIPWRDFSSVLSGARTAGTESLPFRIARGLLKRPSKVPEDIADSTRTDISLPFEPRFGGSPGIQTVFTDHARLELEKGDITPWAVDDTVFSISQKMHEMSFSGEVMVDAVQDPESPPPPTIAVTVFVQNLSSEAKFRLWGALAEEAERALSHWKAEHRIIVIVKKGGGKVGTEGFL